MSLELRSGSSAAEAAIKTAPHVWDMTLPWARVYWDIATLRRYHQSGYSFVNLTIQDMPATFDGVQTEIADFQALCAPHTDWLVFAPDMAAIEAARAEGRLALGLNVQDTALVQDDLQKLSILQALGVRHMLLAYQTRNAAADGCAEPGDAGLSLLGRRLVAEMNRIGMIVDLSHTGRRSSLEAAALSAAPVIFSHSGVKAICRHIRNIDDDQIDACAATGGVVGVVGIGAFLGDPTASAESVFRHLDYVVQRVGPRHAGIGTDFIDNLEPTWKLVQQAKESAWRDPYGTQLYEGVSFAPEQLVQLVALMQAHGYPAEAVHAILGGNFRRVYADVFGEAAPARQPTRTVSHA